jgi:hypothetical protein
LYDNIASYQCHVWVSSALDAALKVPALPLDGESPCCPTRSHPSDLIRNVEEGVYCERACQKLFRFVLVVEAGCMDLVSFSETKGANAPLIIYHPFTDSQLDFVNVLLTDLKLQTEIEDSNKGAEMIVIAIFGKATLKDSGGDKQRPHGPRRRRERRTICCWVGNGCPKR